MIKWLKSITLPMPEQFHPQPTPENTNKETLLKELLSEKTRQDLLNYVKRYIKGTSSEDAEDVVQKILFKATRAINNNKFIDGSKLKSWLGTIAHHATVDLLKKRGRRFDTGSLDKELEKNGFVVEKTHSFFSSGADATNTLSILTESTTKAGCIELTSSKGNLFRLYLVDETSSSSLVVQAGSCAAD